MIFLTKQQICGIYGDSFPSLNNRFNADDSSSHKNDAYQYEFGYLHGRCIYAIIEKTEGGTIAPVEAASLMAINGPGVWRLVSPLGVQTDSQTYQTLLGNPVTNLGYGYTPDPHDAFYPSALFASHQLNRRQLVVYHPLWQVDLSQVEANPLS